MHLRRGHRRAARASPRRPASRSPTPRPARARCPGTTRCAVGGVGATGTPAANALAREADVVIGVGTRYSDFTTASRTAFQRPGRAVRQPQRRGVRRGQARRRRRSSPTPGAGLDALHRGARRLAGRPGVHARERDRLAAAWDDVVDAGVPPRPPAAAGPDRGDRRGQRGHATPRDVVVQRRRARCPATCTCCGGPATRRATTSSTATRAWATRSPAALGVKMAAPDREVFVAGRRRLLPDDGAGDRHRGAEGIKLIVVLVQNHGFASIGALSESLGSQRFGTSYRYRDPATGTAGRRHAAGRPGRQRGEPGRRR